MTQTIPLGELVSIKGGGTPSRAEAAYWGGGIPWATVKDFKTTRLDGALETITSEGVQNSATSLIPPGSVIVPTRMAVGKAAINSVELAINQDLKALLPGDRVDPRFLLHFMLAKGQHLESRAQGATVKGIKLDEIKRLDFPRIKVDEQRRIAAILDKADAIRRKREHVLALADDLLKSTFLEMFGDPATNPKGWPVETFGDILTQPLRNGVSPSSRGTVEAEVLTLSAITGLRFDANARKPGKFVEAISANDQVSRSDFYICRGNGSPDLIGRGYFADQDLQGVAFPDTMIAAKPNPERVARGYLEAIWQTASVRGQIIRAARTTNGTFKINQTATSNLTLPLPPIEAQRQFERITSTVRSAQAKHQQERLSDQLFASLSQRAFRGEL